MSGPPVGAQPPGRAGSKIRTRRCLSARLPLRAGHLRERRGPNRPRGRAGKPQPHRGAKPRRLRTEKNFSVLGTYMSHLVVSPDAQRPELPFAENFYRSPHSDGRPLGSGRPSRRSDRRGTGGNFLVLAATLVEEGTQHSTQGPTGPPAAGRPHAAGPPTLALLYI